MDSFPASQRINAAQRGVTLIELLVVMALMAILMGVVGMSLARPQSRASVDASIAELVADIKQQQMSAQTGMVNAAGETTQYGVLFSSSGYTLFSGSYSTSAAGNFTVTTEGIEVSSTLPGGELVFLPLSGEVANYTPGADTITVSDSVGSSQTLRVSRYGAIELQ